MKREGRELGEGEREGERKKFFFKILLLIITEVAGTNCTLQKEKLKENEAKRISPA